MCRPVLQALNKASYSSRVYLIGERRLINKLYSKMEDQWDGETPSIVGGDAGGVR